MKINTSANLPEEAYLRLGEVSENAGVSRRDIISALLRHVVKTGRCRAGVCGSVRYQKRTSEGTWRCLHLGLRHDEYEFYDDLKKLMKMSVSYIISWAIVHYLDEFLENVINKTDNYRYMNYTMYTVTFGNVFHIILCWGIPPQMITDS